MVLHHAVLQETAQKQGHSHRPSFSLAEQLDGNGSDCAVSAPHLSEFVVRSSLTALFHFKGYGSKGLSG